MQKSNILIMNILLLLFFSNNLAADIMSNDIKHYVMDYYKKQLPIQIDSNSVCVDLKIEKDIWQYYIQVDTKKELDFDLGKKQSISMLCGNKASLDYLKKGMSYRYFYYDKYTSEFIRSITITKKDCK